MFVHYTPEMIYQHQQSSVAHHYSYYHKRTPASPRKNMDYANGLTYGSIEKCPWTPIGRKYSPGIKGISEEIEDYLDYVQPTTEDRTKREQIIARIRAAIHEKWPEAEVEVFGSFKTGLYLPTGDIDLVIKGSWDVIPPLFDLERQLVDKNVGDRSSFKVLDKASVPLIKFRDAETQIRVDLAFNQANCTEAADFVLEKCRSFPVLRKLLYVLKQLLTNHGLNEVFHGGLSSYSLTLMILSYLQLHTNKDMVRSDSADTATLLLDFLDYYGSRFEYDKKGLRLKNGGEVVDKAELRAQIIEAGGPPVTGNSLLCIQDPLTPANDVARSSYNFQRVREVFKSAHSSLLTENQITLYGVLSNPRPASAYTIYQAPQIVYINTIVPQPIYHQEDLLSQSKMAAYQPRKNYYEPRSFGSKRRSSQRWTPDHHRLHNNSSYHHLNGSREPSTPHIKGYDSISSSKESMRESSQGS